MAPFQNLHLQIKFAPLSPIIDAPSFHLYYLSTYTTADITDVSSLVNQVISQFNSIPSGAGFSVASVMSDCLSRAANQSLVDVYDVTAHLNGTPAGSPVLLTSFTLAAGQPTPKANPEGVAAVITLQAPYGTDVEFGPGTPATRPRARDRGRIYVGPLDGSVLALESTTNRSYLVSSFQTTLVKWIQAINVITTAPHTVIYNLAVWSRKGAFMKSLQECWVDDRPDYQRRRSDQAASRLIQGLP